MSKKIEADTTMDDLLAEPTAYGLPTFDEFARNSEKYLGREDDRFTEVERGSQNLNRHVQRHIYEVEGYRCKTLEEVERIAAQQGIPLRELDYRPEVIPTGAGKCDLLIKFVSKTTREKRKLWG